MGTKKDGTILRGARRKNMPMMNVSNGKPTTTMTTLDKLWNKMVEEETGIDMEGTQEKEQGQTNKKREK